MSGPARRVLISADDFGLSLAVNEAVERAHRDGVLMSASLMVAGDAAEDAVRRARRLPDLRVGLHLVTIEARAVLPPSAIPLLVDGDGWFGTDQLRLGIDYFFRPAVRRQLAAEIGAQFEAFAATGLPLAHADAHKHMHLHPTIGALLLREGARHGLRRVRVPMEPPAVLAACGSRVGLGGRALAHWTRLLRHQVRRAGMECGDQVFGIAWTGAMTEARVLALLALLARLPAGDSEIYFHPAAGRDPVLDRFMPEYRHEEELATLLSPSVRAALERVS